MTWVVSVSGSVGDEGATIVVTPPSARSAASAIVDREEGKCEGNDVPGIGDKIDSTMERKWESSLSSFVAKSAILVAPL